VDYAVTLKRDDNDTILVTFPDFPEAQTFGTSVTDALERAVDALATIIDAYIKDRRDIPRPTMRNRTRVVRVPALIVAKIRLYESMRASRIGKTELARRLKVHGPQVDRLLAMHHGSQLSQIEAAFEAMGKRLRVEVEDLPTLKRRSG